MKSIVKFLSFFLIALFLGFNGWVVLSGKSYFYKALYYNFADIDDYKLFPSREIKKSTQPIAWPLSSSYNKKDISTTLRQTLDSIETVALLLIKEDSIIAEHYWDGYSESSRSNSFSMAKSYVSVLVGIALKEGAIRSIQQPVCDFLPSFCLDGKKHITIEHLLKMSSGLSWEEGYASPFSPTTEAYYGTDLKSLILSLDSNEAPGKVFRYKSGDTQLLSFVLEKATNKKMADYAQEKLWEPLGCEQDALWSLDKKGGDEKAYCCLNSNARDFAKLGKFFLDSGRVRGQQLLPLAYVLASIQPSYLPDGDLDYQPADFYGYQWWVIPSYKGHFVYYARGILGQYVIVVPDLKAIAVRLGKQRGNDQGKHYHEVYVLLDELLIF